MSHGTTGGHLQQPVFLGCYFQHSGYFTLTKCTKEKISNNHNDRALDFLHSTVIVTGKQP